MRTLVILSGGLDSTVLLYSLLKGGHEVRALAFDYGQRHLKETEYAQRTCDKLGVPFRIAELHRLADLLPGSSQTDHMVDVPEGHYEDETMKTTVVPNRNMIMLSVAVGHAIAVKADLVAYGAHDGDHAIYPDCRAEFVTALEAAIALCDWTPPKLAAPFTSFSKATIVQFGNELGVPFGDTWSCYKGGAFHCGKCGTCVERIEAFELAGVTDPTVYA